MIVFTIVLMVMVSVLTFISYSMYCRLREEEEANEYWLRQILRERDDQYVMKLRTYVSEGR